MTKAKKINVIHSRNGTRRVPVGEHKYHVSYRINGNDVTKEVAAKNMKSAKHKAGVAKKCYAVRMQRLLLNGTWETLVT